MAKVTGGVIAQQKQEQALTQEQAQYSSMKSLINSMQGQIAKALPSVITPERFTRMVLSAISTIPALQKCNPNSFLGAMMQAAQLGVEPNTPLGQAYLIPYGNMCQFQLGYRGLIELANRNDIVVQAHEVCENDEFAYEYGLHQDLVHKPALANRGAAIAYYAVWQDKNKNYGFIVLSKEDIEKHARKFSKTVNNGPWKSDFDAMAKKTAIKQALKYAPIKTEFVRGIAADESVKSTISDDMLSVRNELYNEENTIAAEAVEAEQAAPESAELFKEK